ncbi:hypothetical protein DFH27DRAFT_489165 [Peziza echinospora]|nr:hypothetical protein DFH27DRAFT_489165 [Peziza echinospora]
MTSASKVVWSPHSNEQRQQFLRINARNNELGLYEVTETKGKKLRYELVAKQTKIPDFKCFDWSPVEEDLIAIGQTSGDILLLRICEKVNSSYTIAAKPQRGCNTVAFNREGLLAAGLERVRHDSSLYIWDINQRMGTTDTPRPQRKNTDQVTSLKFFYDQPNLLIAGMGTKQIRIFDLRDHQANPTLQAQTKCVYGITVDKDQNYFASYSDEGVVAVWDRRLMSRNGGNNDHVLMFNRTNAEEASRTGQITCLRYSTQKAGVFSVLKSNGGLKVYETTKFPDTSEVNINLPTTGAPATSRSVASGMGVLGGGGGGGGGGKDSASISSSSRASKGNESIIVGKITQLVEPIRPNGRTDRRICSMDWMYAGAPGANGEGYSGDLKTVCLRYDGELEVFTLPGSVVSTAFSSRNTFVVTSGTDLIMVPGPKAKKSRPTTYFNQNNGRGYNGGPGGTVIGPPPMQGDNRTPRMLGRNNSLIGQVDTGAYMFAPAEVLKNDICMVMKGRVEKGYGMSPTKSLPLVPEDELGLREMWTWLQDAVYRADHINMVAHSIDLNYVGVSEILKGNLESRYVKGRFRSLEHQAKEVNGACEELRKRLKKDDFIGATNYHARRSLALVVCGWQFNRSDLENQIRDLERNGEYAKAAGWALFHNDIPRCIKSLSQGGDYTKAIATAVAGYLSHQQSVPPTTGGSTWKELCRRMAIDVGDPYLRAIYAYVANGEWVDVLDDVGLHLKERLGIAIRFLSDEALSNYVEGLTQQAVKEGDVEGILLTGVTEPFIELLQNYVDRTCDVQTAAIVASFAWPRYLADERVHGWVESYRELLNGWAKWKARGRFDVARGARGRRQVNGPPGQSLNLPPPSTLLPSTKATLCPTCKKPLPRCSVCLLHLGTVNYRLVTRDGKSKDPKADYERWFSWCLKCNHGVHVGHGREWFGGRRGMRMCPVPDCECFCSSF